MKNKHIGSNVLSTLTEWEKEPAFKAAVEEHMEKAQLGKMLKEVRRKEHLTQIELAEMAQVPQSVIARIETGSSRTLPRIDLFNKILSAAGYETHIVAKKKKVTVQVALS
jgi:predicted transcriptional regulator